MEVLIPIAVWLLCGLWASRIMAGKGRSVFVGWLLGLGLGIFGVIVCALVSKTAAQRARDMLAVEAELQRMRGH